MTEKNFNTTNSSIKRTYNINNEFQGEEKMTNQNYNTDGRHFANTDNTQNFDDLGKTRTFENLYSCSTGYNRNADVPGGQSKKPQLKKVSSFFRETPPPCTAYDLVRAVFEASVSSAGAKERQNPALVLGYVKADGETIIFSGDLSEINISLEAEDKIIVYTDFVRRPD